MATASEQTPDLVLSREQLIPGESAWVTTERVRVRRRIVTETVSVPVTIRREELIIERAPLPGKASSPGQHEPHAALELVLRHEVPVVTVQTQPYELVRVRVTVVAGQETVQATLNREEIDLRTEDSTPT